MFFSVLFFCCIFSLNGALVRETGNIIKEIEIRKRVVFKKNREKYREFSKDNKEDMVILVDFFDIGIRINTLAYLQKDLRKIQEDIVALKLDKLNYDFVVFTDTFTDSVYYELREKITTDPHGWGSYIFNPEYTYDVLIECPHPKFDRYSTDVGIRVFRGSDSKAFFMAGAHRFADSKKRGIYTEVRMWLT